MKACEKYSDEIPQEAVRIIAALDDPLRIAILVLLNKSKEFSFSDIQREFGISKLTLNYHLKNLYSAGLIDHYFRHELGNQKYSYYAVTSLGTRVLNSIVKVLTPPSLYSSERKEQKVALSN
jgi:DNA-binding transcriptional ArsR family regulator